MSGQHAGGQHRLFTWYWKAALEADLPDDLVLVRTSLGRPRWARRELVDDLEFIGQLAPYGLMDVKPWDAFAARYCARLDSIGVEILETRFREIQADHDGASLVLLCYEHSPGNCHRGLFSEWWTAKTGEIVPEYPTGSAADPALFVEPPPPDPQERLI